MLYTFNNFIKLYIKYFNDLFIGLLCNDPANYSLPG